ncbi:hypothetical protein [Alkalilimnicola sp. S0819]|uniref:hypothetical protein n=1 Tax=Alkalilimnicola sp. S0819 TaxID=2613922 RepID=UPI001261789E|nr:hypothetical protein [Alkalilimnicola sp. S0819]KAB7623919.1 hypothetical protein F3N43_07680 [Alkalilimnicola sp. S0819]MPQ16515.1 hypothetical protein [Alkalilimnicola sp. S0819]
MKRKLIRVLVMGVGLLGLGAAQAGPGLVELKKAQLETLREMRAMPVHQRHGARSQVCFGPPGFQICQWVKESRAGHKHRHHDYHRHGGRHYHGYHRHGGRPYHGYHRHGGRHYHGHHHHRRGEGYHNGHRHHGKGYHKKHRRHDHKHRPHRGKHHRHQGHRHGRVEHRGAGATVAIRIGH